MKNFVIVGTHRTGSSAIGEAIAFHSQVACGWEWTERIPRKNKIHVAQKALTGDFSVLSAMDKKHMAEYFNSQISWLGYRRLFGSSDKWLFHPKYSLKLWLDRMKDHIDWFRHNPDIHIIHIIRHDNVDWLKSKYVARKAGSFVGKAYPKNIKVEIPVGEAVKRLYAKKWVDDQLSSLAHANPYLQLSYEDLSLGMDVMVTPMINFLGCKPETFQNDKGLIKRQSTKSSEDYIENYDILIEKLKSIDMLRY